MTQQGRIGPLLRPEKVLLQMHLRLWTIIDGTDGGVENAVSAIDSFYQDAIDPYNGEFILQLVGVLDNLFDLS